MENNWEPRVGQKVVALRDGTLTNMKKGDVFTVLGVKKCCSWSIDVGLILKAASVHCWKCRQTLSYQNQQWWFSAYLFAPIPEQYADMTSEIAQQFKEHPDTVDQPVKVLEVQN